MYIWMSDAFSRASLKLPSSLPTFLIKLEDLYHQASAKYILYYSSSLQENIASNESGLPIQLWTVIDISVGF